MRGCGCLKKQHTFKEGKTLKGKSQERWGMKKDPKVEGEEKR